MLTSSLVTPLALSSTILATVYAVLAISRKTYERRERLVVQRIVEDASQGIYNMS